MSKETVLFKSQEKRSRQEIVETMRQLADKIEQGSLQLRGGGQEISLDFPAALTLEIKVEDEQKASLKRSLELELEWYPGQSDDTGTVIA
jgi:amphi-Trp domain-containing protein